MPLEYLAGGKTSIRAIPVLDLDNVGLLGCRGLLHHGDKIGSCSLEIGAVLRLEFADLDGSLEGGLIDTGKKVANSYAPVNAIVAIRFDVCHLLKDLLMVGNVGLKLLSLNSP